MVLLRFPSQQGATLSYSDFLGRVGTGQVKTVDIKDTGAISGTLKYGGKFTPRIPTALDNSRLEQQLQSGKVEITATQIAVHMVREFGLSSALGPVGYGSGAPGYLGATAPKTRCGGPTPSRRNASSTRRPPAWCARPRNAPRPRCGCRARRGSGTEAPSMYPAFPLVGGALSGSAHWSAPVRSWRRSASSAAQASAVRLPVSGSRPTMIGGVLRCPSWPSPPATRLCPGCVRAADHDPGRSRAESQATALRRSAAVRGAVGPRDMRVRDCRHAHAGAGHDGPCPCRAASVVSLVGHRQAPPLGSGPGSACPDGHRP
ncbi:ATP-dependent metallopeptidase FtsH/Yme1/Tma family protein [Streptomyces sp. NPDC017254]|uniref:ATP-dependent metallopeptidase FtsH/Yme1/Tma family protein n=1 Tax=unclassified Streptomyces TaxID=2593676 RepID=UPI0037BA8384